MKQNILLVDDDKDLMMITKDLLENRGYHCFYALDAQKARELLYSTEIALIILDINLPGTDGFLFCKQLREESEVPVIFVSARTNETDKITGLDLGGDDYLSKPYSLLELFSRIQALLRRTYGFTSKKPVTFDNITIDLVKRQVYKAGIELALTTKEFNLLNFFITHPHEVISKEKLFAQVWGNDSDSTFSTLYAHIRWLREKIEMDSSKPQHLITVHGIGYRFEFAAGG